MVNKYLQGDTIQGNKYRQEGVLAQQYQENERARKYAEWLSRLEMRPTVIKKATRAEKIKGKKDVVKHVPQVIGMSGADPIGEFIVGGIGLGGIFNGLTSLGKAGYNVYKLNKAIGPKFDRSKLGRMIGRGKEQRVYDGGDGSVYKVYGRINKNSTKLDLKDMKDFYELRNTSPANLPVEYAGYIKNNHNQYLSVFKLPKAEIPTDFDSFRTMVRDGKKRLKDLGYKHWTDYRNANHDLIDVHPGNFGLYKGEPVVLDGVVIPRKPGTIKIDTEIPGMPLDLIEHVSRTNSDMDWVISNGYLPNFHKKGGKTHKPSQRSRPWGHRSILDNGWQSTKLLKNKKNVYGK